MKYLKILGLAAIVAAAVTALVGAGTAGATVFCATTSTPCNQFKYQVGVKFDASLAQRAVFRTTSGEVLDECVKGTAKGIIGHEGSGTETVLGTIEELTWVNCTTNTVTVAGGFYEVHNIINTDNGTVTSGNTEVTLVLFGVTCTYSYGERKDIGTLKGGAEATLEITSILTKAAGGFLCPTSVIFNPEYKVTEPKPLYVEEA